MIVAVRLAKLVVPDLNVNVAVPSAPVVTVEELTMPVSVPKATTIPGNAALDALNAVTVKVVELELSDGTVVREADKERLAAVAAAVVVVVVVVGDPPAPQPDNKTVIATKNKAGNVLA